MRGDIWKTIEQLADEAAAMRELNAGPEQDSGEAHLIEPHEAMELDEHVLFEDLVVASLVPPCCSLCAKRGERIEQDGTCPHGYPSVVLALGLI